MKKYSKLLLSLIVSSLKAFDNKEVHTPFADNVSQSSKFSKSSSKSLRETLMSVGTSVALKKGNEMASYGTIYDWAANARTFESEQVLHNLFGDKLRFLTDKSVKIILSVIQSKVKSLIEQYKKADVEYTKVENLPAFYESLSQLKYSVDASGAVNRSSEIEDRSLIDDPKIQKELASISEKDQVVSLVKEKDSLKVKFYLKDNKEAKKTASIKVPLKAENFQVVYSNDVCELQFLNKLKNTSSVSKIKLGIKQNDLKELLGVDVMPVSSELKEHGEDFVASNSEFIKNLFQRLCSFLDGSKDKKQNAHENVNMIKFMNKLINISVRTVLGNLFDLNEKKQLKTSYLSFDQVLFPKSKLSFGDDLFEFKSFDKVKNRTYIDANDVEAAPDLKLVSRYSDNVLLMFFYEQEDYKKKEAVLSSEKTPVEKKAEIRKIEKECSEKISRLQKENRELLKNSVVQSFFGNEDNFHITQEAIEKIMTGKRNLETIKVKYEKIQKEQPNIHANLAKSHKTEKTNCCC